MKPCKDKINLSPEDEKKLNESVYQILCEGLDIVRKRFPKLSDFDGGEIETFESDDDVNPFSLKP